MLEGKRKPSFSFAPKWFSNDKAPAMDFLQDVAQSNLLRLQRIDGLVGAAQALPQFTRQTGHDLDSDGMVLFD